MRARLIHRFDYRYSKPVQLGPHRFCLRPRPHGFQRLIDFRLEVSPDPSQLYELMAAGGDTITRARFLGDTEAFSVLATSEVETFTPPLIEACLDEQMAQLPLAIGKLNPDLKGVRLAVNANNLLDRQYVSTCGALGCVRLSYCSRQ